MPIFDEAALKRQAEALPPDSVYSLMTAPPAERPEAKWPYAMLLGGQGADVATTIAALQRPGARELNPILTPLSHHPVAFGAVKMGLATFSSYGILRLEKSRPRLAFILAVLGTGFYSGVVYHNARLLK